MSKKVTQKDTRFEKLNKFLRQNKKVDIKTIDLLSKKTLDNLNWKGIDEEDRLTVLKQLKAHQRLTRLTGDDHSKVVKEFLERDLHSSIQIGSIPKEQFMKEFKNVFKDEDLMRGFYARALATRSKLLLKYMGMVQNGQRHTKAVKAIS
ncbi:MAG: hypothetical protein AAGA66_01335 [Bacteroidota bacterium]